MQVAGDVEAQFGGLGGVLVAGDAGGDPVGDERIEDAVAPERVHGRDVRGPGQVFAVELVGTAGGVVEDVGDVGLDEVHAIANAVAEAVEHLFRKRYVAFSHQLRQKRLGAFKLGDVGLEEEHALVVEGVEIVRPGDGGHGGIEGLVQEVDLRHVADQDARHGRGGLAGGVLLARGFRVEFGDEGDAGGVLGEAVAKGLAAAGGAVRVAATGRRRGEGGRHEANQDEGHPGGRGLGEAFHRVSPRRWRWLGSCGAAA